jgi:hypothetical protein
VLPVGSARCRSPGSSAPLANARPSRPGIGSGTSELRDDPELRAPLTSAAPVRAALVDTATGILRAIGVRQPATHAVDLVGLVDALLLYDVAAAAPLDASRVLTAYIAGLPRR